MSAAPVPSDITGQLFHTYTTINRRDASLDELAVMVREDRLRLFPHPEVQLPAQRTWAEDPIEDANWRFQYHSLVWLDRVREAATAGDDTELFDWYLATLRSWIDLNPIGAPASNYSWFDMAVGLRAVVLAFAVHHVGREQWLLDALDIHGQHLADPANYDSRGNHGLHQDLGLLVAGHVLARADWIEQATGRVKDMFTAAIDEQGVCREGCIDYQYRNYRWYHEAMTRLEAAGVLDVAATIRERLARMPGFLAHATAPSGDYAVIGDTLLHSAPRIEGTPGDWVRDRAQAPATTSALFDAGYLFARRNWSTFAEDPTNAYLTQRFGPGRSTAVHGHEDAGSITFDAFGETLLRDSGLYAYEAGDERLYFRGRSSHNVIDVPGRKYYPSAHADLLASDLRDDAVFTSVRVTGLQGVVWHRALMWCPDLFVLIVDDRVRLHGEDDVLQRWQLPVGARVRASSDGRTVNVRTGAGNELVIEQCGSIDAVSWTAGSDTPVEGWFSGEYRQKTPAPSLAFEARGHEARFTTVLSARRDGQPGPVVRSMTRTSKTADVVVESIGAAWRLALTSEGASREAI